MLNQRFFCGFFSTIALFTTLCLSGCGENVKVSGRVAFEDGSPLSKGTVVFQSATNVAKGVLDASGEYQVGSLKKADGLPPGTYTVYIADAAEPDVNFVPPPDDPDAMRSIHLIASEYASPSTTPFHCEIKSGGRHDFTVKKPE